MEFIDEEKIDEIIKAQAHIWNYSLHFIKSMCLKFAVQVGVPDIIHRHNQPMSLSELALALQVHPSKTHHLYRIMRILVHAGFFHFQASDNQSQEGYTLTPPSRLLLKDSPFNTRPFISLVLDPIVMEPYNYLVPFVKNDDVTPFVTATGKSLWGYGESDPRINRVFNEGMASDCSVIAMAVIIKCKEVFQGLSSLVDVGGGTGNMAKAIAKTFPNLNCTVFDLPQVVDDSKGRNNLSFVAGDMFQAVPPADAILLKWILHDWTDEECVKILKNCKEAILVNGKGGKLIIIDMVMGNHNWDDNWTEVQLLFDMEMMACVIGKERNEKEWANLFFDAGFGNYKIHPVLGPRALIEVYP